MSKLHRKFVKSLKWSLKQTPYVPGGDLPGVVDFLRKDTQLHIQILKLMTFYLYKEDEQLDVLIKVEQADDETFVVEIAGLEDSNAISFVRDPILPELVKKAGLPIVFQTEIRDVVAEGLHTPPEDLQEILQASDSPEGDSEVGDATPEASTASEESDPSVASEQ